MTTTVVYVAYRTPVAMLQLSIESILFAADAAKEDVEVLVVDNGGAREHEGELPGARIIGAGQNVGFGHAVNDAVREARGERVLLMNPDSTASPTLFDELDVAWNRAPSGTFFGALLRKGGRPQVHAYNVWWGSAELALRKRKWAVELDRIVALGDPAPVARLCGAGLYASREALAALGPFDESYFLYGEDVDLSLRAKEAGHRLVLVPRAVIEHDAGTSSEGASELVEQARTDAHLRLLAGHRGRARSLAGRAEHGVATIAGVAITRSKRARNARLARLSELRRWGLRSVAPRFVPPGGTRG